MPDHTRADSSEFQALRTAAVGGEAQGPGAEAPARPNLGAALNAAARAVEATLDELLPQPGGGQRRVQEAMRYAVFAGGKRLRPFLTLHCADLYGVPRAHALRAAAAIEALHTYSLVHDDLPAMDDDDLRRGNPTTHRKFDEATAILAGDALLTLAFEILGDPATHPIAERRAQLVLALGRAAGSEGMVGGQMIDIDAPHHRLTADEIIDLQRRKTGALFEFSCCAGGILGGASPDEMQRLIAYARDLGLAFQICDDLIDVLGAAESAGKQVGKDEAQGKATLVSLWGVEQARAKAESLARSAAESLSSHGARADLLRELPIFLLDRRN
ncbi:MAG TPA: farnesyl diphosphate synthase [Phenylobacterium sp.]|uniref:polyprenyl synthetase family protein n=1 Tax=Phenylobacterium sp. TaxID=1871053 RepID=UPI002B49D6E5|nr:farnesyl diphosphate synthase [Phenylobacterium sp.]HKR87595.1 farnesyl diphosphate synthase [Phenylobacterium sp.]